MVEIFLKIHLLIFQEITDRFRLRKKKPSNMLRMQKAVNNSKHITEMKLTVPVRI